MFPLLIVLFPTLNNPVVKNKVFAMRRTIILVFFYCHKRMANRIPKI